MKPVIVPDVFSRPQIKILCVFISVLFSMLIFSHQARHNLYSCPPPAERPHGQLARREHFAYLFPVDSCKSRLIFTIYIAFLYNFSLLIMIFELFYPALLWNLRSTVNRAWHYRSSDAVIRISYIWRLFLVT